MTWEVPQMWSGGDVWILGGGPSIPKQFGIPDSVVKQVLERTSSPNIYSPYMQALHSKHVIGINVSFMIGDWLDMVFFGDSGFFDRYQSGLASFRGIKVTCNSTVGKTVNWVKYTPCDHSRKRGISKFTNMVSWNGNSGAAAISIAAHTGAKRIILLGFDMNLSSDKMQHWHDVYQRGKVETEKRLRNLPFDKHLRGFEDIAKDAKKRGIEIINASPDSAITQFPKYTVKELLNTNN